MLKDTETPWQVLSAPKALPALTGADSPATAPRRSHISGERTDTDG